jgi:hypothetical protein
VDKRIVYSELIESLTNKAILQTAEGVLLNDDGAENGDENLGSALEEPSLLPLINKISNDIMSDPDTQNAIKKSFVKPTVDGYIIRDEGCQLDEYVQSRFEVFYEILKNSALLAC